ncbi:MAG: FxSxx-COOH system tetratricopeptide repeat protein [Pyrinomonadaceae bacterium]
MYLEAARRASKALDETLWHQMLKEKLDLRKSDADESSLKLSELIWKLGSNLIITTNVDRVLQWTCPNSDELRPLDLEKFELGELQKEKEVKFPTVLYLHGRIHNSRNVVFTPEQYKGFYEEGNNQAKLQTLVNTLTKFTTLFIGFSLDDEYFLKQLNLIDEIYEGGANSFYILLPEDEKDNPNIPKYVEKIIYKHHGKPLIDLLEEMCRIANGDDNSESLIPSPPPDSPVSSPVLQTTTLSTFSGTISSTQKIFKPVLSEKHFNVPFASKGDAFVGREGLREKIWESLNRSGRAAIGQAVSIKGIGGLGKTQLAVEYAYKFRDKYENGVFWLTADEDIDIQLIKIGEDLKWISQFNTGFDQAELVRNRFRKLSGCLIIFDNVDDKEAIENYLPESDARPHILITSREKQEFFDEINLDVLSRKESRKLLLEIYNRPLKDGDEETALEKVLEELGDLPLAVELVGGFLAEHEIISFREYLEFLDEVPLDALEEDFPSISFTHHDKSIIRTLKISEKLLTKKPQLEEILDILAWSGKSSMGYSLLQSLVEIKNNYILMTALSDLVNLRLIKEEKETKRYTIHRLVARVRKFEKPLIKRKEWHQKVIKNLVEWFRKRKDEFEYLLEFENETIHLQQWQSQSFDVLPIETAYLIDFEAYPLWHRGNYQESKILLDKALNLYQENQLNDEKLLANLYNDSGVITGNLGNIHQRFEDYQKALLIGRNIFDEKSEDIAKFLSNLGGAYSELGNYQKALELQQQAFDIRLELFGEKHPDVAASLNSLGGTYDELGNPQKALELKQQALEIVRKLFGEKHPDVAASLNNLGGTYGELGNPQKALGLQQQALEIRLELFGKNHPSVADSLSVLGWTYVELRNPQKALELQQQALEIYQELFDEKHPDVAASLSKLGGAYMESDDPQKALKLQQQSLEVYQELFGEKHFNVATSLSNLGKAYIKLSNPQKALELEEQALKIRLELFGEKHPSVADSLNNLGEIYSDLGNHQKAVEHHDKALQMIRDILGNQHPRTILYCNNLILELLQIGYREKAGRLAGEFLSYVPQNNPYRKIFEEYGAMYRKARQGKKKRRH